MAYEIEDKFLAANDSWRADVTATSTITQTYLIISKFITIRTRLETGKPAIFCIKLAARKKGTPEFEWRMPTFLARWCSKWRSRTLRKLRHLVPHGTLTIEVDEFLDNLDGLVMAEVEKPSTDYQYDKPSWFGKDVTNDRRYKNALLLRFGIPR